MTSMSSEANRIIIEYNDGTTAVWGEVDPELIDEVIEPILIEFLGQPDTLHC